MPHSNHARRLLVVAASSLSALMACPFGAQAEDRISTDRPDFVESSLVVGKGRFQIETGFSSERNQADGVKERLTTTPTLLRYGVSDTWEIRLETDGAAYLRSKDLGTSVVTRTHGAADISLGAKWHVQDGDDEQGRPGMAWLFHADVDTGSEAFRGNGVRPSVRFVAEWELPGDWSVGVMPGVVADKSPEGKRFMSGIAAVTVAKSWTDNFRTFVELSGQQLASKKYGGNVVTFDAGAAYLIGNDMQVDIVGSWGANRNTPDFQWGVGFSIRF